MDTTTWTDGPLGRIQLNRPRTINALTPTMIAEIREAIHAFEHDPAITAIAVDGAGERGLCSGADVRAIREAILTKGNEAAGEFWRTEYAMNAEIHALTTPYAAFMDGIVMGGGVGVSTYGSIRVTTPRTRLAMPETGIGLFPDVGTMFTLSRAPGQLGTHMALTGLPVSGADAVIAGFADAVIDPQAWPTLLEALKQGATKEEAFHAVDADTNPRGDLASMRWISECYQGNDPAGIIDRLINHSHPQAREAGEVLRSRSPLSVAVTLEALRRAERLPTLQAVLDQDLTLATNFTQDSDFLEGVRAVLVDKDNAPQWRHRRVEEVDFDLVKSFFT